MVRVRFRRDGEVPASLRWVLASLIGVTVGLSACGPDTGRVWTRADAVAAVVDRADLERGDAECIVDDVLGQGLVADDFRADESADPRFARTFEAAATRCLL
jgi:hypothetical protein